MRVQIVDDVDLNTAKGLGDFIDRMQALEPLPNAASYLITLSEPIKGDTLDRLLQAIKKQKLCVPFCLDSKAIDAADDDKDFLNECIAGLIVHNQSQALYGSEGLPKKNTVSENSFMGKPRAAKGKGALNLKVAHQQAQVQHMEAQQEQQSQQQEQQEQQQEQSIVQNFRARSQAKKTKQQSLDKEIEAFSKKYPSEGVYYNLMQAPFSTASSRALPELVKKSEEAISAHENAKEVLLNALGMFNFSPGDFQGEFETRKSPRFVDAIESAALLKLLDNADQVSDGLDFEHLPQGFYVQEIPATPGLHEKSRVLCYHPEFKPQLKDDDYPESLRLQFVEKKEEKPRVLNHIALYAGETVSLEVLKASKDKSQEAYEKVKETPSLENIREWINCLGLDSQQKNLLFKYQEEIFDTGYADRLFNIIEAHGLDGLNLFIRDFCELKEKGKEAFIRSVTLDNFYDGSDLGSKRCSLAVMNYLSFSKSEQIWFEKFYNYHVLSAVCCSDPTKKESIDFSDMVTVFSDFLTQMKKIDGGVSLPEQCPIVWLGHQSLAQEEEVSKPYSGFNMRVALTRFLSIVESARDPKEQLREDVLAGVDLSHSSYYYAVQEGFGLVTGDLDCRGKETLKQECPEVVFFKSRKKHVYKEDFQELVSDFFYFQDKILMVKNELDENKRAIESVDAADIGEKQRLEIETNTLNKKTQDAIEAYEKILLRYVACQEQRKDINFYKRTIEKIKNSAVMNAHPKSLLPMMYMITLCTTQSEYEKDDFQSERALEEILSKLLDDFSQPNSVFNRTKGKLVGQFMLEGILNVWNGWDRNEKPVQAFNFSDLSEAMCLASKMIREDNKNADSTLIVVSIYFKAFYDFCEKEIVSACIKNANRVQVGKDCENEHAYNLMLNINIFSDEKNQDQVFLGGQWKVDLRRKLIQAISRLYNSSKSDSDSFYEFIKHQLSAINENPENETLKNQIEWKINILASLNPEKTKPAISMAEVNKWMKSCVAVSEIDIHIDFKNTFPQARFGQEYNDGMQNAFEVGYQATLEEMIKALGSVVDNVPPGLKALAGRLILDFSKKLKDCRESGYAGLLALLKEYTSGMYAVILSGLSSPARETHPEKGETMKEYLRYEILDLYNKPLEMHARELVISCGLELYQDALVDYQSGYVKRIAYDDKEPQTIIDANEKKREEVRVLFAKLGSIKDEPLRKLLIDKIVDKKGLTSPHKIAEFIGVFDDKKKELFHLKNQIETILNLSDEKIDSINASLMKVFGYYPECPVALQSKLVSRIIKDSGAATLVDFIEAAVGSSNALSEKQALKEFLSMYPEPSEALLKAYCNLLKETKKSNPPLSFALCFKRIQGLPIKNAEELSDLLVEINASGVNLDFLMHLLEQKGNSLQDVKDNLKLFADFDASKMKAIREIIPIPLIKILMKTEAFSIEAYQTDPYGKHADITKQVNREAEEKFVEQQVGAIERYGVDTQDHISDLEKNELLANYQYFTQFGLENQKISTVDLKKMAIALRKALKNPALSDKEQLKHKLQYLAVMREAYYRATGKFPYSTQMLTVLLNMQTEKKYLFEQIKTGEGKGMIAALQAGLMQAQGYAVDVFSSDFDQLSRRDHEENKDFFALLGVKTSLLAADADAIAYHAGDDDTEPGIHYTTASNVSLYQAARMIEAGKPVQLSGKRACVCDESDDTITQKVVNIYSDNLEGGDPYVNEYEWLYGYLLDFAEEEQNKALPTRQADVDAFKAFLQTKMLSPAQHALLACTSERQLDVWLDATYQALRLKQGEHFLIMDEVREMETEVKNISVAVILENSKPMLGAQWSNGLHQLLHLRLNREKQLREDGAIRYFPIDKETCSLANETNAQVLETYQKVLGISGSVIGGDEEKQELFDRYPADVLEIPTHNPNQKKVHKPLYFSQPAHYLNALFRSIKESMKHDKQPVLILCKNFNDVVSLQRKLQGDPKLTGYTIQIVGDEATSEELESKKMRAGQPGVITIATPRFGRGTDINPSNKKYGLKVIETYVATTRDSIQNQGRPARNGMAGEFQRIIDLHAYAPQEGLDFNNKAELAVYIDLCRSESENADIKYRKINNQAYEKMNAYLNYLDKQNFPAEQWKKMRAEMIASCCDAWDMLKENCMHAEEIDSFSEEVQSRTERVFKEFDALPPKREEIEKITAIDSAPDKKSKDLTYAAYHNNPAMLRYYFEADNNYLADAMLKQSELFYAQIQHQLRLLTHLSYIDRLYFGYMLRKSFSTLRRTEKTGAEQMAGLFDCILTHCQKRLALHKMNDALIDTLLKPIVDLRVFLIATSNNDVLEAINEKQKTFVKHLLNDFSAIKALPIILKLAALNSEGMPEIDNSALCAKFEEELRDSIPGFNEMLSEESMQISNKDERWDRVIQALKKYKNNLANAAKSSKPDPISMLWNFINSPSKENEKIEQYLTMATQFKALVPALKIRPSSEQHFRPI